MTQQQAISRDQLIQSLRNGEQQLIDVLAAVDPSDLESGCYENGWNAREVLAHIASIEWTYPKVLDLAKGEDEPAPTPNADRPASTSYSPPASGGILSYNDRQVEKRAGMSTAELLGEFRENRARTIAAIESADDELLSKTVRSAGGIQGPANVLQTLAVGHVTMHVNDILGAVKQA